MVSKHVLDFLSFRVSKIQDPPRRQNKKEKWRRDLSRAVPRPVFRLPLTGLGAINNKQILRGGSCILPLEAVCGRQ